jgi:hypothetical protein
VNIRKLFIVVLVLAAAGIPSGAALAKGVVSVTISGPGLGSEIEVTDLDTVQVLMDLTGGRVLAQPKVGDTFYRVAIGFGDPETGEVFATNVYHYYPNPQGGPGYVLFADAASDSRSTEGQWFRAAWSAEQALHKVLAGHGISMVSSKSDLPVVAAEKQPSKQADAGSSESVPAVAKTSDPTITGPDNRIMLAGLGGLTILLVGGALVMGRNRQAQA